MDDVNNQPKKLGWNIFANHEVEHVDGWIGDVSHNEAESRLQDVSTGTYVIRSGDKTSSLTVDQLMLGNHRLIAHYLLVVKKEDGGVEEHMILHTSQGWMVYGDEVHLGAYRPATTLPELLTHLDPSSYHPLTRTKKDPDERSMQVG